MVIAGAVEGGVVVAVEVPAADVVHVAVAVVIDSCGSRFLLWVLPDVRGEVRVIVGHPFVYDADDDLLVVGGGGVPGFGRVYIAFAGSGVGGVVEAPQAAVGVVRIVDGRLV